MPGFINFKVSNARYIVPVDNISMVNVSSATNINIYLNNGSLNPASHQETNQHHNVLLYNEYIRITTASNYAVYVGEALSKLIARVEQGDYNGYAEVEVDGQRFADFDQITAIAAISPTQYDLGG